MSKRPQPPDLLGPNTNPTHSPAAGRLYKDGYRSRANIILSNDEHDKLKRVAAALEISVTEFVTTVVLEAINELDDD